MVSGNFFATRASATHGKAESADATAVVLTRRMFCPCSPSVMAAISASEVWSRWLITTLPTLKTGKNHRQAATIPVTTTSAIAIKSFFI